MECLEIETMSHNAGMLLVPGHSVWGICVAQRGTERGFVPTLSVSSVTIIQRMLHTSNRGADKSLARPGRKQATVTKLLQATQKQFRSLPSNQFSAAAMTSASEEKWRPFNCFSVGSG